jgi:hypothetical protein
MWCPKLGKFVLTSDSEVFNIKKVTRYLKLAVSMVQITSSNPLLCYWNSKNKSPKICLAVKILGEVQIGSEVWRITVLQQQAEYRFPALDPAALTGLF